MPMQNLPPQPYEVIVPLKDRMPREKLRKWVTDPDTPVTRIGLYGLLLGTVRYRRRCRSDEAENPNARY